MITQRNLAIGATVGGVVALIMVCVGMGGGHSPGVVPKVAVEDPKAAAVIPKWDGTGVPPGLREPSVVPVRQPLGTDMEENERLFDAYFVECDAPEDWQDFQQLSVGFTDADAARFGVGSAYIMHEQFVGGLPGPGDYLVVAEDGQQRALVVRSKQVCEWSEIAPATDFITGEVLDGEGRDVGGAWIVGCGSIARSDVEGKFSLTLAEGASECSVQVRCHPQIPGKQLPVDAGDFLRTTVDLHADDRSDAVDESTMAAFKEWLDGYGKIYDRMGPIVSYYTPDQVEDLFAVMTTVPEHYFDCTVFDLENIDWTAYGIEEGELPPEMFETDEADDNIPAEETDVAAEFDGLDDSDFDR